MADPRLNRRTWMAPTIFPTYNRSRVISDVQFAENPELHECAFWAGPEVGAPSSPVEKALNYTKRKKKKKNKTFSLPEEIPKKEAKGAANNPQNQKPQHSGAKNPQQPNPPGVSQPANVQSTQHRQTGTQNRDVKKRKAAGEAADADVPTQPHKKLTTQEANGHAERPSVNSYGWRGDASTMFSCSLCQYLTADEKQIQRHLNCVQHREVLKHLKVFFPKERVDFLHEYLLFKKNMSTKLMYRKLQPSKDYLKGIGQEHYIRRVQAAHCQACDVLIPNNPELVAMHIKSDDHRQKRQVQAKWNIKNTFQKIKADSLWVAKKLFKDDDILRMLTKYDTGQNPFEAGSSSQVRSTCETQVAKKEDHTNNEDAIAGARDGEEVPVNHNEGPFHENKDSGNKRFLPDDPEMMEPADMTKETLSKTVEEESEEAAEAP